MSTDSRGLPQISCRVQRFIYSCNGLFASERTRFAKLSLQEGRSIHAKPENGSGAGSPNDRESSEASQILGYA